METPGIRILPSTADVVSFDLWMTLIRSDGSTFKDARNAMLAAEFAPPDMTTEAFDELVRSQDKLADSIAEERGDDVQFEERVGMVAKAAGAMPLSQGTLDALYARQGQLFEAHPPTLLDPDTPGLLTRLSADRRLAAVSNTGFIRGAEMRGALRQLGIIDAFSYLIFSNEVGFAKPHPRIYGALLDAADVSAERVVHIGDNLRADVEGARKVGMSAIHLAAGIKIGDVMRRENLI